MSWLHEIPIVVFAFALGLVLLLAAIGFGMAIWSSRITGALRGRTPVPVNSLTEGYHLAYGKATGPMLKSPLTRRPCVWWSVRVWEREIVTRQNSDSARERHVDWVERRHDKSSRVVMCTQGFVNCAVQPSGMTLVVPTEVRDWQGKKLPPEDRDPPAQPGTAFASTSLADRGYLIVGGKLQGDRYRYREEIIVPNSELFVLGQVERVNQRQWAEDEEPPPDPSILAGQGSHVSDEENTDAAPAPFDEAAEFAADIEEDVEAPGQYSGWNEEADRRGAADMRQAQWMIGPQKGKPYIVAVQAPEHWVGMPQLAGKGGWVIGVAFAALAGFMIWARFGAA